MKKICYGCLALLAMLPFLRAAAQAHSDAPQPVSVRALAAGFSLPPAGDGPTVTWGWQGAVDSTVINRDLDRLRRLGFRMVTIEGGYRLPHPYLSDGYFELIRYAVQAAKKRGMRVWLIDEGKYPSGFAGGLFSEKRPDLRMQALIRGRPVRVAAGQAVSLPVDSSVISAVAYRGDTALTVPVQNGALQWTAPAGTEDWELLTVSHAFRTSPTRSSNNPTGAKDTRNSLCDYLNPDAARQFLAFTHARYKAYIGDEFGKTVVGFRSDEPAYSYTPWTPNMSRWFREQKGYDVTPYLASFFVPHPTARQLQVRADYWEVFSNLFRDHFFKVIGEWCRENHLQYEDHIDHDGPEDTHTMLELGRAEGDYFRDMRYLDIPGIDVIWHQLWPGEEHNFPKLASSATHVFGRRQAFSESFAAYQPVPDIEEMQWILREQLVRGINLFEIMFYPTSTGSYRGPHGFMASDSFPQAMRTLSRTCYALSRGIPSAQLAVVFPSSSLWTGDTTAVRGAWALASQLLRHQLDFDFIDDHFSDTVLSLRDGRLVNRSGQAYRAVLVPPMRVISRTLLAQLKKFADGGVPVWFTGGVPAITRGESFLDTAPAGSLPWAHIAPADTLRLADLRQLPADMRLASPQPGLKYLHRRLTDGDLYYVFNAGADPVRTTATVTGTGSLQVWDAVTGTIRTAQKSRSRGDTTTIPLALSPGEARLFVLESSLAKSR